MINQQVHSDNLQTIKPLPPNNKQTTDRIFLVAASSSHPPPLMPHALGGSWWSQGWVGSKSSSEIGTIHQVEQISKVTQQRAHHLWISVWLNMAMFMPKEYGSSSNGIRGIWRNMMEYVRVVNEVNNIVVSWEILRVISSWSWRQDLITWPASPLARSKSRASEPTQSSAAKLSNSSELKMDFWLWPEATMHISRRTVECFLWRHLCCWNWDPPAASKACASSERLAAKDSLASWRLSKLLPPTVDSTAWQSSMKSPHKATTSNICDVKKNGQCWQTNRSQICWIYLGSVLAPVTRTSSLRHFAYSSFPDCLKLHIK